MNISTHTARFDSISHRDARSALSQPSTPHHTSFAGMTVKSEQSVVNKIAGFFKTAFNNVKKFSDYIINSPSWQRLATLSYQAKTTLYNIFCELKPFFEKAMLILIVALLIMLLTAAI